MAQSWGAGKSDKVLWEHFLIPSHSFRSSHPLPIHPSSHPHLGQTSSGSSGSSRRQREIIEGPISMGWVAAR